VTGFVRERQRSTAALASTSWLLRSLSGDRVDSDRVIPAVAMRSRVSASVLANAIVSSCVGSLAIACCWQPTRRGGFATTGASVRALIPVLASFRFAVIRSISLEWHEGCG
jgi:hypothetical protein